MDHSTITEKLIQKVKTKGYDPGKQVFTLTIADIVECIVDALDEDALKLSDRDLEILLDRGIESTEWILWSDTIQHTILDTWKEVANKKTEEI